MSDTSGKSGSDNGHHDATPGLAPDRSSKAAMPDSFPASDAMATTSAVGSRAVDPADMMHPHDTQIGDATTVTARFADLAAAKRTVEHLVQSIPLDRRRITVRDSVDQVVVEVAVPQADTTRVATMMQACGGESVLSAVQNTLPEISQSVRSEIEQLRAQVEQLIHERVLPTTASAIDAAGSYAREAKGVMAREAQHVAAMVRERPLLALAVTTAIGFLLGRVFSSNDRA